MDAKPSSVLFAIAAIGGKRTERISAIPKIIYKLLIFIFIAE